MKGGRKEVDDAGGEQGPSLRGALMLRPQAWLRQNVALAT
jgi:hypothetical protein